MKAVLASLICMLAAGPAIAGTGFTFTCEASEGDKLFHITLVAETGGGVAYGPEGTDWETRILWFDQGDITIVVGEADPSHFYVSFDGSTGDARMPYEPGSWIDGTCRVGGAE